MDYRRLPTVVTLSSVLVGLLMAPAFAEPRGESRLPTPTITGPIGGVDFLGWAVKPSSQIAGFFIYWAPEVEAVRTYSDAWRVQLPVPDAHGIARFVLNGLMPASKYTINGRRVNLCFRVTAFDRHYRESAYSNEWCGWSWMAMPNPDDVKLELASPMLPTPTSAVP